MKKIIIALTFFPFLLMGEVIIIEKDDTGYTVKNNSNKDGSLEVVKYKLTDDLTKILPVMDKSNTSLSKEADYAVIFLNDDGTFNRALFQVNSKNKETQVEVKIIKTSTVIKNFKDEVHTKLGLPLEPDEGDPTPEETPATAEVDP